MTQAIEMVGGHFAEFGDLAEILGIEVLGVFPFAGGVLVRAREARAVEDGGTSLVGAFPSEQTHRDVVEAENFDRTIDRVRGCGDLILRLASGGRNGLLLGKCIHTLGGKRNNPHQRPRDVTLMTTREPLGVEACKRREIARNEEFARRPKRKSCAGKSIRDADRNWAAIRGDGPSCVYLFESDSASTESACSKSLAVSSRTWSIASNSDPEKVRA